MRALAAALGLSCAASVGAEVLYRLPWPEGLSFMITQAPGGRITSHFTKSTLNAVDIGMPEGVPVLAARDGIVETTESRHGAARDEDPLTYEGNFVRVRHADGSAAIYAHLKHGGVAVSAGDAVAAGQLLGHSGMTGDAVYPHLHFAVTREVINSAGWREEVSVPMRFFIGVPPVAFSPRIAVQVRANYSGPAEAPRAPSETTLFRRAIPVADPDDEATAWRLLGFWLLCGVAALTWFWRFSRE